MKKDTPAALATTETEIKNTSSSTPPSNINIAIDIENRHEVKDYFNVHFCRFLKGFVFPCSDNSCPYSDSCGAFNEGER